MIRQATCDALGYSVVEIGRSRHVFTVAAPRRGGAIEAQLQDVLGQLDQLFADQDARESIVTLALFVRDEADRDTCRQHVRRHFAGRMPATSYVLQPPCDGRLVAAEAMALGGSADAAIDRVSEHMVVARHDGIAWVHVADIRPDVADPRVYPRAWSGFRGLQRQLSERGYRYEQVIRTWLYLGDIVGPEGDTQRYKELNRARSDFYDTIRFESERFACPCRPKAYPASTGIGTEGRDIVMSCIALETDRDDVVTKPLENPKQTAACDYGQQYGIRSPMFSRAMAVVAGRSVTTLVSGTASITGEDTQHLDDVAAQTDQTLTNIEALISDENLAAHGLPGCGARLDDMALMRVYVKYAADFARTREVCRARLGDVPTVYTIGDVCRPELLVEIEGIVCTERRGLV